MTKPTSGGTACIIEARMRSSRLPGKVLLPIRGRPMLQLMVDRVRRAKSIDQVIIATTEDASCDPIEGLATKLGVACFRGSEDDVLDRVLQAARANHVETIVEATGDCPLLDPAVIDRVVATYHEAGADYCSNVLERTYPRGMDVQVFATSVLEDVARRTREPRDREHVSLFIYEHPELYSLKNVASGLAPPAADLRLTVDTPEDLNVVRAVFEELDVEDRTFSLADILELYNRRPALFAANARVRQKAA